MRATKGCQACRTRHTKCIKKKDQSVCTRCQENNQECIFDSKWRFKHVAHVDTASQGVKSRTKLVYNADQPWVSGRRIAKFVLESGDAMDTDVLEAFDSQDDNEHAEGQRDPDQLDMDVRNSSGDNGAPSSVRGSTMNGFVDPPTVMQQIEESSANQASTALESKSGDRPARNTQASICSPSLLFGIEDSNTELVNETLRELDLGLGSSCSFGDLNVGVSPAGALASPRCFTACLSHREVLLMQHFIHKLSPWVSSTLLTPYNPKAKGMSSWTSAT